LSPQSNDDLHWCRRLQSSRMGLPGTLEPLGVARVGFQRDEGKTYG